MEKLISIIKTLDRYRLREIDILDSADSNSRYTMLYREITLGNIKTDDEAAKFLFGSKATKNYLTYRVFKKKFKERVFNALLFIDTQTDDFDDFLKIQFEANKQWLFIKNLYNHQLSSIATELAEELLNKVVKFEYYELAMPISNYIKSGYALKGDKKNYAKFQKLFEEYTDIWLAERKAREYNEKLKMEFIGTSKQKPHVSELAKTYFKELKPLLIKYNSYIFHFNSRAVELYIYTSINDYKNQIKVSERAISFFESKSSLTKLPITIFLHQKMEALMYLKQYEEAEKIIIETMKLRVPSSFNWYIGQSSRVFLLFRMKRYSEAKSLYDETVDLPNFKSILKGANLEIWELFNAYFHLLFKLGKAPELQFKSEKSEFKIKKFLNETPTFEGDKKGMQLARLIVQIYFMIVNNEMNKIFDKVEAVKKYLIRNTVKTDPTYRFQQFAKLLLEIPKLDYSPSIFNKNTKILLKNLSAVATPVTENIYRAEVIELEELWQFILEFIKLNPEIDLKKMNKPVRKKKVLKI